MRSYVPVPRRQDYVFARVLCLGAALALSHAYSPETVAADAEACLGAHEQAQVDRIAGHYLAARAALFTCAQRECPRLIRDECSTWLGELEHTLPSVVFAVSDELGHDLLDVHLSLNDAAVPTPVDGRAVALDPGVYKLRVEAAGYVTVEQSLSIRDGEKNRLLRIAMSRAATDAGSSGGAPNAPGSVAAPPSSTLDTRSRRLWLASSALAAASVASFTVTLAAGTRGFRMVQHCHHDGCSDAYVAHGKSLYRAANVGALTGGVLLAAAAGTLWGALWRTRRGDTERGVERGVAGVADNHGAVLTAWSRW